MSQTEFFPNSLTSLIKDTFSSHDMLNKLFQPGIDLKLLYGIYRRDDIFNTRIKSLMEFYLTYNPNYKNMKECNPQIPEYNILLANMLKDLYILYKTKHFPDQQMRELTRTQSDNLSKHSIAKSIQELSKMPINNEQLKELKKLLGQIEKTIQTNYFYNDVIICIELYISLFNFNFIYEDICDFYFYESSPYIIFPSFYMLSFYKVDMMIGVPIFNFSISNKSNKIHNDIHSVCNSGISHDLNFHQCRMKFGAFKNKDTFLFGCNICLKFRMDQDLDQTVRIMKIYFPIMNCIILKINDKIEYKNKNSKKFFINLKHNLATKSANLDDNIEQYDKEDFTKYLKSFFLFVTFHEFSPFIHFSYDYKNEDKYQMFRYLLTYDFLNNEHFIHFLEGILDEGVVLEPIHISKFANYYDKYFSPLWCEIKELIIELIPPLVPSTTTNKDYFMKKYLKYKAKYLAKKKY